MPAGERRERIAFDQRALTSDGYGNASGDWAEEFVRWARVRPRLGGETVLAARLAGTQPVTITILWSPPAAQITPAWRARNVNTGVVYNIRSVVNPDEKKKELDILAEAGVEA